VKEQVHPRARQGLVSKQATGAVSTTGPGEQTNGTTSALTSATTDQRRWRIVGGTLFSRHGVFSSVHELLVTRERSIGAFTLLAFLGVLSVVPSKEYSGGSLVILVVGMAIVLLQSVARLAVGQRFPRWTLHVDLILDVILITTLCMITPGVEFQFEFLYLWIIFYVALYFSVQVLFVYLGAVAAAYALVALSSATPRPVIETWFSLFGTAVVFGLITVGLVSLLRESSEFDSLTKLANRRAWERRTEEEFERAVRTSTSLSMVVIDIDDFKLVNDQDGHHAGDALLCSLADGWRQMVRVGGDFVARIGGDEFGYLAPGANEEAIQHVIERLRTAVPLGRSCSFGASSWDGVSTLGELFRDADEAMYRAKRERKSGRGNPSGEID